MSGDHADTGCFFAILVSLSNCSKTKSSPFNLEGAALHFKKCSSYFTLMTIFPRA